MATLLRLATCGSVDDGKSTLIGRLLFDSKAIHEDQLEGVLAASQLKGGEGIDLALLTDGLRAEREQGITIDVAYRYFATERRSFILADTPGHVQYTRNMVTGASTAHVALVLIDARHGVVEQTRRHLFVSGLLGVPHVVVCVNKMDLVGYDQAVFDAIEADVRALAHGHEHIDAVIPISAKDGDNVVDRSDRFPWYQGPALLRLLEDIEVDDEPDAAGTRLPVQYVIRDGDVRHYAGRLAGGSLAAGDEVVVLPAGRRTTIASVDTFDGPLPEAAGPVSITVTLADHVDVSRGDLICRPEDAPEVTRELTATVCWMADAPLRAGARLALKHTTNSVRAIVDSIEDRLDVTTLQREAGAAELGLNDIGTVHLRTSAPVLADPYSANRTTGSFILIDEATNDTVAAGMVVG
jgi:bifunctional enzyme CysN/CysC